MSLTKSILLGGLIFASHTVLTPPTIRAQEEERKKFTAEAIPGFLVYAGPIVKVSSML